MPRKLRPKIRCEICNVEKKSILHRHHIIPRRDARCTNHDGNLAILCPNCHSRVHTGEIIIIGVYQTSDGRQPMWFKKGQQPPIIEEHWLVKYNPLVVTLDNDSKE
jgi:hypothetical protein